MNRPGKKPSTILLSDLMPESCFMDLQTFNSEKVSEHIDDKEAYQKTVHAMLQGAIKERLQQQKEQRRK